MTRCVFRYLLMFLTLWLLVPETAHGGPFVPRYPDLKVGKTQYASFPLPLEKYDETKGGLWETLKARAKRDPFNVAATVIFFLAICHTFLSGTFLRIAHRIEHKHDEARRKRLEARGIDAPNAHEVSFTGTLFHFLGEIEAVFGIWVLGLIAAAVTFHSWPDFMYYVSEDRTFTEPLFVVVIMVIAASRPVLRFAEKAMSLAANLGGNRPSAWWLSVLLIAPLLGSAITEPAAMTIAALLLARKFYRHGPTPTLAYGTLGLLFVSISIGGTLTNFAAPPVLMVAGTWGWSSLFMLTHFGWKAVTAIALSTALYFFLFRGHLRRLDEQAAIRGPLSPDRYGGDINERDFPVPAWVTFFHLGFLGWTVYAAHFPVLFMGGFLFFNAFVIATRHHQTEIQLRGPVLVGFFLAGLIIHGGCQAWWIEPVIKLLSDQALMIAAAVLTAFNDNAAITYLAAQVQDIGTAAKYAVVAGAVLGGGLTVIANAPNPTGQSLLSKFFKFGISPAGLLAGALVPTIIAYLCFAFLPGRPPHEGPPPSPTPALEAP